MNMHRAYPLESAFLRDVMHSDSDGVIHMDEARLADLLHLDNPLATFEIYDLESEQDVYNDSDYPLGESS